MDIRKEDLDELKELYLKRKGQLLTDDAVADMGKMLIRLFEVIGRRIPQPSLQNATK